MVGAEIRLSQSNDHRCSGPEQTTRTDESGRFAIGPLEHFRWFIGLLGDRVYMWNVCIIKEGSTYAGAVDGIIGKPVPAVAKLTCNITPSTKPITAQTPAGDIHKLEVCRSSLRHITMPSGGLWNASANRP